MKLLKIQKAANKRFNGKNCYYDQKTGIAKLGRTEYEISFGVHQPNIDKGDYSCINHTLETATRFTLYRLDSKHANIGIRIYKFTF